MFDLQQIDHVALSAADVERSTRWYVEVLGFERLHHGMWNDVPIFVGKGDVAVAIFPDQGTRRRDGNQSGPKLLHFALRTDRENFVAAQTALTNRKIAFEFQDHDISHSIYLRDPDGHEVEITTYEV